MDQKTTPTRRSGNSQLSFLCYGIGAIGTYIGGSLALSGKRVVFVDRPGPAEEVRQRGMCLKLATGEHVVENPEVVTEIDEALQRGPYDAILLAVKSFDTHSVIDALAPYRVALPPFICLQNGVENEVALTATFGIEKVIPGSVTTAVGRRATGNIAVERLRGIGLSALHPLSQALFAAFNLAGLNARLYDHPEAMKWSKMLTNLMANASSAILDMTPAEIFANPGLYRLELGQLRECINVMSAQHIRVVDLPGTPVGMLGWAVKNLPPSLSQPFVKQAIGRGRGGKMPSFHIDLHAGRGRSEVDYLNGAVVRFGQKNGIDTPVNRFLNETLLGLTAGEIDLNEFSHQPEKLLALVQEGSRNGGKSGR
jgi:2-dehydropantoate 2-reductase